MARASSSFKYDPEKHSYETIVETLKSEGFSVIPSRRLAYDPEDIPEDWPVRGHILEGYDISIQPPIDHPIYGMIGQVACAFDKYALHSATENRKVYNNLKLKYRRKRRAVLAPTIIDPGIALK